MKNKKYLLLLLFLIPLIVLIGKSFSYVDPEIKSIEIQSNNYNNPGSWHINKSAKWIGEGKVEITFDVNSIEKTEPGRYKDIMLVMDTSGSMNGLRLNRAIADAKALTEDVLSDSRNKIALITFNTNYLVNSDFTNDKATILNNLDNLRAVGGTNYYIALYKANELLRNYVKEDNRDLLMIFLTDGYPNYDTPNQISAYRMLKDNYPYMTINGIQYEMGNDIIQELIEISDNQWSADMNTLHNVLFDAASTSTPYENFIITDIINDEYFYVDSIDSIKADRGTVELTNDNNTQKVIWNIDNMRTGVNNVMKIVVNLKDNYLTISGEYPTNKGEVITSKLKGEAAKTIESDKTPILKNKYKVSYNTNTPSGCDLPSISNEYYFVGNNVTKNNTELKCDGYTFVKWDIEGTKSDIETVNDEVFIMPGRDVKLRAVWSRKGLVKSMNGSIRERGNTLYNILQDAAIDGEYAREYTGAHQDSNSKTATKKVYHWYADRTDHDRARQIPEMYNVKFANNCWRMIRTTDTGGVRLIYNGEYDDELKCGSGRHNKSYFSYAYSNAHAYQEPISNYYFADSYTYDATTNKFTLVDPQTIPFSISNPNGPIGKYYCRDYPTTTVCDNVYKVIHYDAPSPGDEWGEYILFEIYPPSPYNGTSIGRGSINIMDGDSIAEIGYMYGDNLHQEYSTKFEEYSWLLKNTRRELFEISSLSSLNSDGLVASSVSTSDYIYSYGNFDVRYTLNNPVSVSTITNYNDLIGKYYYSSNYNEDLTGYYYIVDVDDNNYYYIKIENYHHEDYLFYEFTSIYVGDSITENSDHTYTINNGSFVRPKDFANNVDNYSNKIICLDGKQTCDAPVKINSATFYSSWSSYVYIDYEPAYDEVLIAKSRNGLNLSNTLVVDVDDYMENYDNYKDYIYTCGNKSNTCREDNLVIVKNQDQYDEEEFYVYRNRVYFGADAVWDGTKYTLTDPLEFDVYKNTTAFTNHRFFCLGVKSTSCEKVAYITTFEPTTYDETHLYFILLENGEKDVKAIYEDMMYNNTHDSFVKAIVDEWYKNTLLKYNSYVDDDAVYCNNRKPLNNNIGYLKKDANILNRYDVRESNYMNYEFYISNWGDTHDGYDLTLKCDQETDRFSGTNQKAKLKYPAALLTYDELALMGNRNARILSDSTLSLTVYSYGYNALLLSDGSSYSSGGYPILPAITLKPGTQYIDGDGSSTNPYVVDTSEVD